TAFLVYGSKYRADNMRGLPVIATSLETMKKLERYKEAAVGSAEERAKIAYQIVHGTHSSGESPLASQMASAFDANGTSGAESDLPKDALGDQLANTVAATTNKATFNMPQDSELKALESKNELFFKEFYSTNSDIMCAAVGIPPNVAFSIYNDSFSASRTATKDWEHTMTVGRKEFGFQFYQPIYNFWLHIQILMSNIQAPGYLSAFAADNELIVDGYRRARYTGTMFPHIDPLKEVKAERAKLGDKAESIPLTTIEQATEALNAGDSVSNMNQFAKELEKSKDLGITVEEPEMETTDDTDEKSDN
ncbi:MAG: phage portal protein, partial [Nanoarchaeota archaeon]|nr:phage portal protein [Nanoarchaeota archaeon]